MVKPVEVNPEIDSKYEFKKVRLQILRQKGIDNINGIKKYPNVTVIILSNRVDFLLINFILIKKIEKIPEIKKV